MSRVLTIVLTGTLLGGLAIGQGKPVGTQPGQVLPGPFTALIVTNPDAPKPPDGVVSEDRSNLGDLARVGKFHDLVTYYGLDPTVAVFSRQLPKADQPLAKLLQGLDQEVVKHRSDRMHAFAVFLSLQGPFAEDAGQPRQVKQIKDLAEQLKLAATPLALDRTESEQAKAYDIPADATAVVLIYVNQTVQARHVFGANKPVDDAAIQAILDEVNKLIRAKK
jgi:hypothetical protein